MKKLLLCTLCLSFGAFAQTSISPGVSAPGTGTPSNPNLAPSTTTPTNQQRMEATPGVMGAPTQTLPATPTPVTPNPSVPATTAPTGMGTTPRMTTPTSPVGTP